MKYAVWLWSQEDIDTKGIVDLGVEAEEAGWDGVFVSDSLPFAQYPDPWVLLAGIAARTEDISLGTWVVPLPRRDPWQVASEVATLDQLSGGRVIFGAGLGNADDYEAYGRPYEPRELAGRMDESLDVITGLWAGEPFSYEGEHFELDEAEVHPTPIQEPRPPILLGAWWPNRKPFQRGARWDGIVPFWAALTGDGTGPHGEEATGSPEEELREMMAYYTDIADDPGEVVLPTIPSMDIEAYGELCAELGGTWVLETSPGEDYDEVLETIREGPP